MSSISPMATKTFAPRINELGADYVDAPVSGGEVGAKAASLDHHVRRRCRRCSSGCGRCSRRWARTSPWSAAIGDGQTTKVANQIIVALNIAAVGEALLFASEAGADPAKVRQALMGGFAASRILEVHGERMIKRTFDAGLSHPAAPEGPGPGAAGRARARRVAAADRQRRAADAGLRRQRHGRPGPLGAGQGARADGRHDVAKG